MPSTAFTPSLPGLAADDELDTVINWGLGADSTAYLARMLTGPAAHGIDLDRTAVLYMATGSEWPETRLLCDIGKSGYQNLRNGRVSGMSLPSAAAPPGKRGGPTPERPSHRTTALPRTVYSPSPDRGHGGEG
ncbi:hypothetical protein [Streptomyces tunisiensis]|uniref:hypothetical protein n=1 Tax=Streptomyces tunisiensis TaxID=948699 RepID=UPI003EE04A8C